MSKNSVVIRKKKREKKKKKKEKIKRKNDKNSKASITPGENKKNIEKKQSRKTQIVDPRKLGETTHKEKEGLKAQPLEVSKKEVSTQNIKEAAAVISEEDKTTNQSIQIPTIEELFHQKKNLQPLTLKTKKIEDFTINQSLNNEKPKIKQKKIKELDHELQIKTREIPELKLKTNLEKSYSEEILKALINRKPKYKEQGTSGSKNDQKPEVIIDSEDSRENGKPPEDEAVESLFEKFFKTEKSIFPSDIDADSPYVIFLPTSEEDKYIDTLWIILREIFRKYTQKGKPISKKHDKKDYLESELEAEDRVEVIEEKEEEFIITLRGKDKISHVSDIINKTNIALLKNRLKELISQGFGFIIFHLPEELIRKIEFEINKENWRPNTIYIKPQIINKLQEQGLKLVLEIEKPDSTYEELNTLKKKVACYFWGLIEPTHDERWKVGKDFDAFFCACELFFKRRLREIYKNTFIMINDNKVNLRSVPRVKLESSEGKTHKRIKILVLKYLLEHKKEQFENIKIEEDIKGIRPDIAVKDKEVYEIETFYGRGDPEERIIELIKKYQVKKYKGKIKIVITNLDAILWYKEFIKIKNDKRKENIDIEFLTLDLRNESLISIKVLALKIKNSFTLK